MRVPFASVLRACGAACALLLLSVRAAEPVSPLIGATLEQVMAKYGEPKSQITVGDRLVIFYPKERIVVRGGRVVEVEQLAAEPVRRAEPPPVAPRAEVPPAGPANQPPASAAANPANTPATLPAGAEVAPSAPAVVPPPPVVEPKLEIKLVRPPSANAAREPLPLAPAKPEPAVVESAPPPPMPETKKGPTKEELAAQAAAEKRAADLAAKNKRAKATSSAVRRLDFAEGSALDDEATPMWRYVLLALVLIGGVGFFVWRWRQRQSELAATSVANTPVRPKASTPIAPAPAVVAPRPAAVTFSADFLSGLDAARFETLVAAYYSKTGVVAARATGGHAGVVQIRISWKGEPRPFAGVLCLGHAAAAIDVKPLQELVAALAKEGIRRGHIVTTGKFAPAARDYAAENQLTLLPGDAFLEKLNALPENARAEIMRSVGPAAPKA